MSEPKGRAVTDEQKKLIVDRLFVAWCNTPSLRLGQLISTSTDKDIFYLEDEELIAEIESFEIEHNVWQRASAQYFLKFEQEERKKNER